MDKFIGARTAANQTCPTNTVTHVVKGKNKNVKRLRERRIVRRRSAMQGPNACGIAFSKHSLGRQGTEALLTLHAVRFLTTHELRRFITRRRRSPLTCSEEVAQSERWAACAALVKNGSKALDHALRWRSTDGDERDDKDDDSSCGVDRKCSRDGVHERPPVLRGETGA